MADPKKLERLVRRWRARAGILRRAGQVLGDEWMRAWHLAGGETFRQAADELAAALKEKRND